MNIHAHRVPYQVAWIVASLMVFAAANPALANIAQAQQAIYTYDIEILLDTLRGSGTDLPPTLASNRDIYVLVLAGAAYGDVTALANPAVPASKLAQDLETSVMGTLPAGRRVFWSNDQYSAAELSWWTGHFGALDGVIHIPLGAMTSGLKHAGYSVHPLVRVPRYATLSIPIVAAHATSYSLWYDDRSLAGVSVVTVRATISPAWTVLLFLLFAAPLLSAARIVSTMRVIRSNGLTGSRAKMVIVGQLVMPVILTVFAWIYATSLPPVHDLLNNLWFGSSSIDQSSWVFFIPAAVLLGINAVPFMLVKRSNTTSDQDDAAAMLPENSAPGIDGVVAPAVTKHFTKVAPVPDYTAAMSPEEKALLRRSKLVDQAMVWVPMFAPIVIGALWPKLFFGGRWHNLATFICMVIGGIMAGGFKRAVHSLTRHTVDEELTWRARQIARGMGERVDGVRIDESGRGKVIPFAELHARHEIVVSRRATEVLNTDEMAFILAVEIASRRARRVIPTWLYGLALAFVVIGITGALIADAVNQAWLCGWFVGGSLIGMYSSWMIGVGKHKKIVADIRLKGYLDAERSAIDETGNPKAALSAIEKMLALCSSTDPMGSTLRLWKRKVENIFAEGATATRAP